MSLSSHPVAVALVRLVQLMARLREPGGCPWDREQTHRSLLPYTIEEVYEVLEAVEAEDDDALREELGDLLFHVVFYSRIAEEERRFDLAGVIDQLVVKMERRHPHVFGELVAESTESIIHNWEEIKRREKEAQRREDDEGPLSVFEGVSGKLPALLWAFKIQKKMAKVGFDWRLVTEVVEKVREELAELEEAHDRREQDEIEEELGDLLFTVVNLARHLEVNPELALRRSTLKFQERFRHVERRLHQEGVVVEEAGVERMEQLWQESKRLMRSFPGS